MLSGLQVYGQVESNMMAASKMTSHLKEKRKANKIKTPDIYRPIGIVVTDIRDIGYGNRCVSEATQKMGFVYVPMPIQEIERKPRFYYFIHNQAARFKVTLKNGPFWQKKLKKSIKNCRQTTGDFTG
jgi:hypothetical protein